MGIAGAARTERVVAYARLPHAVPIAAVLATTLAMTFVVGGDATVGRRLAILAAMLGAQVALGVVNELVDVELDRATKPSKPLASGAVSVGGARAMLLGGVVLAVAAGSWLGPLPLLLCVLGGAIGAAYSLWFKQTPLAWLPYLLALPLLPIWVAVCLDAFDRDLLWLYPLGALAVVAVQLAQSAPDVAADRAAGIVSVTTRLGERRTLAACWAALVASAAMVALLGGVAGSRLAAALFVLAGVAADVAVYGRAPRRGVLLAFPLAAGSAGVLGLAWVYATGT